MAKKVMIEKGVKKIKPRRARAVFITFEGAEASGKSSVISFLERCFKGRNFKVAVFREPGSTKVGEKIRRILLDKNNRNLSRHTELLLYLAARTQLIEERLKAAFEKYDFVICDRFYDSTLVYQGYALGLGSIVEEAVNLFSLGIEPDLTVILDTNVRKSLGRVNNPDRIESRSYVFHRRLKEGYRKLAAKHTKRIRLVNADKKLDSLCYDVEKIISDFVWKRKKVKL
ncbi:MAG: dTMP kinase [Candidatus Omnitrophota bacterium]